MGLSAIVIYGLAPPVETQGNAGTNMGGEWEGNKKRFRKSRLVVRASEEEISVASRNRVRKQGQERCIHYVE